MERFLPDSPALVSGHLSGKPFHVKLVLLKDLVLAMGCNKKLHRLGNRGTAIEVYFPNIA